MFALGPFDRSKRRVLGQRFDDRERILRVGDHPFAAAGFVGLLEIGKSVEKRVKMRAFGNEIAPGTYGFACDRRHDTSPPAARLEPRPFDAKRRYDQSKEQVLSRGRKLGAQARLGSDLARRLRVIGMHLEMTGERAQSLLQLLLSA